MPKTIAKPPFYHRNSPCTKVGLCRFAPCCVTGAAGTRGQPERVARRQPKAAGGATGGSVVFGDGAMYHLSSIGTIVYLRASYETVASRVTDLKGRGVAMKPAQTLREIYEERKDLYEKFAEYIIDVDKQSIEATAKELAKIARNG